MEIPEWSRPEDQMCQIGVHHWSVSRLMQLSKDLPIKEVPLDYLNVWHNYEKLSLRNLVMHMKAVQAADLDCPIIVDEDGEIMDGRHRIMKAMLLGIETIKVVRFQRNPSPCSIST